MSPPPNRSFAYEEEERDRRSASVPRERAPENRRYEVGGGNDRDRYVRHHDNRRRSQEPEQPRRGERFDDSDDRWHLVEELDRGGGQRPRLRSRELERERERPPPPRRADRSYNDIDYEDEDDGDRRRMHEKHGDARPPRGPVVLGQKEMRVRGALDQGRLEGKQQWL